MNDSPTRRNRHPVDELADVRAEIKTLETHEKELVGEIGKLMGAADHLGGDEYIATQSIAIRKGGIDAAALARDGIKVDAYRKDNTTVVTIRLERRAAPT